MDKRQAEVEKLLLEYEQSCLKDLQKAYTEALADVKLRLKGLLAREDQTQSVIYQIQLQEQVQQQIETALNRLKSGSITSVTDFLNKTYEDGYLGVIYGLQGQGIPINIGIDHDQLARTVNRKTETLQFSDRLYKNVDELGVAFKSEMSRGIANGSTYSKIAKQLSMQSEASYKQAMRIVRTEGGRVKSEAKLDSMREAKKEGADIVKQWDSTFDGKTRPEHRFLDGQIREIDEPFIDSQGREAQAPHKFGVASMDINCRCIVVERARWAVEGEEMPNKVHNHTGDLVEAKDYKEWKEKAEKQLAEKKQKQVDEKLKEIEQRGKRVFDKNTGKVPSKGDYFQTASKDLIEIVEVNDYNGIKSVTLANGETVVLKNAKDAKPVDAADEKALTKAQKDAVEYYVSGDGMYINNPLRGRKNSEGVMLTMDDLDDGERALIKDLDDATDRALEPQTVYRSVDASAVFGDMSNADYENLRDRVVYGADDKYARAADRFIDGATGKTITDNGFMSTTTNYEVASDFGDFTGSEKPIVLEIKTTKNTKGLSLAKEMPELNDLMEQDEVLLRRGQKYKILSVSSKDGNIYVQAIMDDADDIAEKVVTKAKHKPPATKVYDKNSKDLPKAGDEFLHNGQVVKIEKVNDYHGIKSVTLDNGKTVVMGKVQDAPAPLKTIDDYDYKAFAKQLDEQGYLADELVNTHRKFGYTGNNIAVKKLLDDNGYSDLPTVLNADDFDALSDEDFIKVYRGVTDGDGISAKEINKQFAENKDIWVGRGVFGDGTYTNGAKWVANEYAKEIDENILSMAIPKNAKVINYRDLGAIYSKNSVSNDIYKFIRENPEYKEGLFGMNKKGSALAKYLADATFEAVNLGYDIVQVDAEDWLKVLSNPEEWEKHAKDNGLALEPHYVVLNRGKVIVKGD